MIKLAIVTPVIPTYSETFIKAHLEQLPFDVHHFYSLPQRGYYPIMDGAGQPLSSAQKWFNYLETGFDRFTGERGYGYWLRRRALLNYWQKNGVQAVLAEYGPVGASLAEVCQSAGIPLLVHFHGRDAYHYRTLRRFAAGYRRMFALAHTLFPVSTDMREQLLALGAPPEKLVLNPYGPNEEIFRRCDISANPPHFLAVGRFTEKKAPQLTIRAFARVVAAVPTARLIMIGDGPLYGPCQELAQQLGVAAQIDFLGPQPPAAIAAWHQRVRGLVQHSVRAADGDSEGTPVAILEAMYSGLPVVATRHAGIKDTVVEEETGYLVAEGDWEEMAAKWLELAKNSTLATQMGNQGAIRIRAYFTLVQHLDRLQQQVERAVRNSAGLKNQG